MRWIQSHREWGVNELMKIYQPWETSYLIFFKLPIKQNKCKKLLAQYSFSRTGRPMFLQPLKHIPLCIEKRLHPLNRLRQVERVSRAPKIYGMCENTYCCPWCISIDVWFNCIATALIVITLVAHCKYSGSLLTGLIYETKSTKGIPHLCAGLR